MEAPTARRLIASATPSDEDEAEHPGDEWAAGWSVTAAATLVFPDSQAPGPWRSDFVAPVVAFGVGEDIGVIRVAIHVVRRAISVGIKLRDPVAVLVDLVFPDFISGWIDVGIEVVAVVSLGSPFVSITILVVV